MLSCPLWPSGVLKAPSGAPGSSPIQVYSSDEEDVGDEAPTPVVESRDEALTPVVESRDDQELASSQGTPQCVKRGRWKPGVLDVEDELPNNRGQPSSSDVGGGLWEYMSPQAASHVASPLKRAHAAIQAWSQDSPVLNKCRRLAPDLPGKAVRVLLPCGGIDAPGWAARALGGSSSMWWGTTTRTHRMRRT